MRPTRTHCSFGVLYKEPCYGCEERKKSIDAPYRHKPMNDYFARSQEFRFDVTQGTADNAETLAALEGSIVKWEARKALAACKHTWQEVEEAATQQEVACSACSLSAFVQCREAPSKTDRHVFN